MSEVYIACVKYCTMNKGVMSVTVDKFDKSMWWRGWRRRGQGCPKWTRLDKISIGPCGGGAKIGGRSSLNNCGQVYVIGSLGLEWGVGGLQVNKFEHVRVWSHSDLPLSCG